MFLDFLLSQNIITENQYNKVITGLDTEFEGNMTKALTSLGISEDSVTQAKAGFYKIPYQKLNSRDISPEALKYISEEASRHYKFIPIAFSEGILSVGATEPENIEGMNALQFISSKANIPFKVFVISNSDLFNVLENYKGLSDDVDNAVLELNKDLESANKELIKEKSVGKDGKKQEEAIIEDAPIIKIVSVVINHAVEGNASDIHIENTGEAVKVRYRVDGTLHTTLVLPLNTFDAIIARIKILSKLRLDEKRKPQDGSFISMISNKRIEFRVSTFPAYFGEKVVMRILDSDHGVRFVDRLDLSKKHLEIMQRALKKPYGIILISGPTGSGKSTTLYSMLNSLDKEGSNILSLEDPVEYQIAGVTQSQVMPEIGYNFATGLRAILRQDPNVIMVGEIRDKETAQLAIQAALTGHLVLSTIHTNNAIGIIPRLVDMGVDPYLIAPTLVLAMAQRLIRRVHPSCKKEIEIDDSTKEYIKKQFSDLDTNYLQELNIPKKMYEIKPSSECPGMTRGRIAVFEMFENDKDIQQLILKNPVEQEIYKAVRAKGMITLKEDALMKSLNGEVMMQEVYGF